MEELFTVEFRYRSEIYYALIRTKKNKHEKQHYITIMNGKLEQLLYGHHIIIENEGVLSSPPDIVDPEILELKRCIIDALSQLLQEQCAELN